jgi:cation transport regulator ChaB
LSGKKRKLNDQAKGEQAIKVSESEVRKGYLKDALDERDEQAVP